MPATIRKFAFFWFLFLAFTGLSAGWAGSTSPVYAAQAVTNGYRDFTFPNLGSAQNINAVTGEKPESKLWWNDGYWWASMLKTGSTSYHIFRLNLVTQDWEDTGVVLDDRLNSRADVLWDEASGKLYVVSHPFIFTSTSATAGQRGELFRYSYNAASNTYTLDSGFPVEVNQAITEALVLAKDSTGTLWVTYVQSGKVMVNHTLNSNDATWGTPFVLPVNTLATVDPSDMASIVAYNGRIGVMWSNQAASNKMYFAVHVDGAGDSAADWTSLAAYSPSGDDHLNLKTLQTDSEGHLYAVVKTSFQKDSNPAQPWIVLLACKTFPCTAAANWTPYTVWTTSDKSPTRPQMLIDTTNRQLYVFSRIIYDLANNKKGVYYKVADLDNISFAAGDGQAFITSNTETNIDNVTTTKQNVNTTTGLVVLASDDSKRYYLHNCLMLTSPGAVCGPNSPPAVALASSSYTVTESAASATITVTLSSTATQAVNVTYTASADTAIAGKDYTTTTAVLTFAVNQRVKTFAVPLLDDGWRDGNKLVNLTLSAPNGAFLGQPATAQLLILDNEGPPAVRLDAVPPLLESVGVVNLMATLSYSSNVSIPVEYLVESSTATNGADYAFTPGTLIFPANTITASFPLTVLDDNRDELDESVSLRLSNPQSTTVLLATPGYTTTLTILDNDAAPGVHFSSATASAAEATAVKAVTVTLTAPSELPVNVSYATSNISATAPVDYAASQATLTFNPGETSKPIALAIANDSLDEDDEPFAVSLLSATNATLTAPLTTTVTIGDDDAEPVVSFATAALSARENSSTVLVTVKLSPASGRRVAVSYRATAGTATADQDFTPTQGQLIFAPGETSQTFAIALLTDTAVEGNETVNLLLFNGLGTIITGGGSATLTLIDSTAPPPTVAFSRAAYSVAEKAGTATITVTLSAAAANPVTVNFATANGTATAGAGNDYLAASGVLTFAVGETSHTFSVPILQDMLGEGDETLNLVLNNASGAQLSPTAGTATLTIQDDELGEDELGVVAFDRANYVVVENVGSALVTVTLTVSVTGQVTVNYATSINSALADSDYTPTSGQLTFRAGQTRQTIAIAILDDTVPESNETLSVTLSNPTGVTLGTQAAATLTILDNDNATPSGSKVYLALISK